LLEEEVLADGLVRAVVVATGATVGATGCTDCELPDVRLPQLQRPATAVSPAHPPAVPSTSARPTNLSRRAPPPQPKKPPQNPFAARTSLLRSLLLPEIRMTVSNLSQAIHFLVDNDFLENVELIPGQANEMRIEVVGEQPAQPEEGSSLVDISEVQTKSITKN